MNRKNFLNKICLALISFSFIGCGGSDSSVSSSSNQPLSSPSTKKSSTSIQAASAFVVLYAWNQQDNEYQVLMGHDRFAHRDYWNLPGGKVDKGEDPGFAACRETYEESVRWYGSDPVKNLKGKYNSFFPVDLSDNFSFKQNYQGKTNYHYFYFKEVRYVDPQLITQSLSRETDHHFKENDDYGWLSWKTFAYHAIKEYYHPGHSTRGHHETIKRAHLNKTYCRNFTWIPFREAQGANYILQITNKELFKQRMPSINTLSGLDTYLTNYYPQRNN